MTTGQDDKRAGSGAAASGVNPGYAQAQLDKALATAVEHADPVVRERALERVRRWQELLRTMLLGTLAHGRRAPVADLPAWATLEVVHGGFASGQALAGGPLHPHERALARALGADEAGTRAAINAWYAGPDGQAEALRRLSDGRYRIQLPEEGALLAVAALVALGESESAAQLLAQLAPYFDRLRFYPQPSDTPQDHDPRVQARDVAAVIASLQAVRPQQQLLAQKEAVEVWAPYHDRVVALFLETVEDGWPCRRYPADWASRARALLHEYARLRHRHGLSGAPERRNRHPAQLRDFLACCAARPESLDGREVGRIRLIVQRHLDKHGEPGGERCTVQRARQRADVAGPAWRDLAGLVASRLSDRPPQFGLNDIEPPLRAVDAQEAAALGIAGDTPMPEPVRRRVERCLRAMLPELVARGLVGSGEEVARLLPPAVSRLSAQSLPASQLRSLYAALYRAFRRRRSLLLLDLQSQVRFEELPWVASLDRLRGEGAQAAPAVRRALDETVAMVWSAFPQALLPN
ncbi:hypothetical protein [Lysobacter sp. CA199]|uniref:hypothetical protein n=1 Tax=Lysobacter sp. CA199 TaxID=3455608 RepID=UPI003F8D4C87